MVNILNYYEKANKIIFEIIKEAKAYIRKDGVLKVSFLID